jgi:hypothetical protein
MKHYTHKLTPTCYQLAPSNVKKRKRDKKSYYSKKDAIVALQFLNDFKHHHLKRVYFCSLCNGWHLTSK